MPTVAIIAPGAMGAALGGRLHASGIRVLTSLQGRSEASVRRARGANMIDDDLTALARADVVLSVLPPSEALRLARHLAPVLTAEANKPVYVDANAVSPQTVTTIADVVAPTGCRFVDVGIIGPPPALDGSTRTVLYASGEDAGRLEPLREAGLDIRSLPGPVGQASSLKMAYAGITKGLTAIGTAMALAGAQAGIGDALAQELKESQPALTPWLRRAIPGMVAKAYRWNGEMREIAQFLRAQHGPAAIFDGAAELYDTIAADEASDKAALATLDAILAHLS